MLMINITVKWNISYFSAGPLGGPLLPPLTGDIKMSFQFPVSGGEDPRRRHTTHEIFLKCAHNGSLKYDIHIKNIPQSWK